VRETANAVPHQGIRVFGQGRVVIQHKFSQEDLAAMAGIARENVSRILRDWATRSLVSHLAGYYCLENKAAFKQEAELSRARTSVNRNDQRPESGICQSHAVGLRS
jgi:hypothetical protein